jgi:hypothetical protein
MFTQAGTTRIAKGRRVRVWNCDGHADDDTFQPPATIAGCRKWRCSGDHIDRVRSSHHRKCLCCRRFSVSFLGTLWHYSFMNDEL